MGNKNDSGDEWVDDPEKHKGYSPADNVIPNPANTSSYNYKYNTSKKNI